jgi:nucleoside diphosphate kinase
MQSTFAWIKPDAVALGHVPLIQTRIKLEGYATLQSLVTSLRFPLSLQWIAASSNSFEIAREGKLQMTMDQVIVITPDPTMQPWLW